MMASVQATILGCKSEHIDDNTDIPNTIVTKDKPLKRRKKLSSIEINENGTCSAVKISRRREEIKMQMGSKKNGNSSASPAKPLTSREKEIEYLETFLMEQLASEQSASLYVSGQPGTGKTASLTYILQLPKVQEGYQLVYVNCTMIKSAACIYSRICQELRLPAAASTEKACCSAIEKYLAKKHKMILLVLNEIDQLDSKRQSVLYTIFEWPSLPSSRVVLIGVANALDLTERTLPRLQARCSLRPKTLHFAPYTKEQIIRIFTTMLASEDKSIVFSPVALEMLAAKIAAVSGDMRHALDIGRRVIELARRSEFTETKSNDTMMNHSTVTVELKQVLQVLNNIYGGSRQIETDVEKGLPMQQKLVLCSLVLMLNKGKNKDVVMGKLYDVYKKVTKARNIASLDMCELAGACALLESHGALRVVGAGGASRSRRVRLQWDEAELTAALRDKPLLSAILNDIAFFAGTLVNETLNIILKHVICEARPLVRGNLYNEYGMACHHHMLNLYGSLVFMYFILL